MERIISGIVFISTLPSRRLLFWIPRIFSVEVSVLAAVLFPPQFVPEESAFAAASIAAAHLSQHCPSFAPIIACAALSFFAAYAFAASLNAPFCCKLLL